MASLLTIMHNEEIKRSNKKKTSNFPSLNQGKKFKKYQNKIENSLEKNAEKLSGKEGFSDMEGKKLTRQTHNVINENNYSNKQQIINNLRQEYDKTLQDYNTLTSQISGQLNGYVDRVSSNNPYLNKVVSFTTGNVCYVTNQGVVKYIASMEIWRSVNIPQTVQIQLNIPWQESYYTPGTQIPTTPPLVSGTFVEAGQSFGNEGSNVFVNQLLPEVNVQYMDCYAANSTNDNMTFIGGSPPSLTDVSIPNGNFSQSLIANNSYKYITGTSVPGWYFGGAVLLNNSTAWGYPMPYPGGNQCISLQNEGYVNTQLTLNAGVNYTLTFSGCSRNCCDKGNPINIQLYTNLDAYISQIANFTAPVNTWQNYSYTFTVPTTQSYKVYFKGTAASGDKSTALSNISLNSSIPQAGTYSYDSCKTAAINNGYRYFGLQNVNTSTNLGYCAVSNSEPAVSQYGNSSVVSKAIALWSSNTSGQTGNTATLSNTGSLQVLNSSGMIVYSSPATNANPSNFLGCYQDCSTGRGLPTKIDGWYDYSSCKSAADSGQWKYFGLQDTQPDGTSECWVGNDISLGMSMGIAGNCTQANNITVGGGCSNAIYNNSSASSNYFLILQDDDNMVIYRGTGPNDNQGWIWSVAGEGKTQDANPNMVASKGKYGQSWMVSGSTLAPGDFIGSDDGKLALVMQTDGNLVLYAYQMQTNCQKMSDGNMGGGFGANAAYDIGKTANPDNMGMLGYIDADSNLYTYPNTNQSYNNNYSTINNVNTDGNDVSGLAFVNATIDSCKSACNNSQECAGFVFDNTNKICYPKNSSMYPYGGDIYTLNNVDIYIRGKQPSTPPLGVSQTTNTIDSVTYQTYANKGAIGSEYGLAKASSTQKQQMQQLQTKLNLLSKQISDLTTNFQEGTYSAQKQSQENVTGIDDYLKDLTTTNDKSKVVAGETSGNIQNILKDSDIVVLQKNYNYLFWSILAAGTVLVSMNIVKKQ